MSLLSANEVLLDDLGLITMFWLRIDWLKNDEAIRCLLLNISDGSVIISDWCSGCMYDSLFISEWHWFSFMGSMYWDIYIWLCFKEVAYICGFATVK